MGNGGLDNGARPVWEDGSGGGSVSALHEVSGPITLNESGDAVAYREDDAIMARFVRDYVDLLDDARRRHHDRASSPATI